MSFLFVLSLFGPHEPPYPLITRPRRSLPQQNGHFQPADVLAARSSQSAPHATPFVISCQVAAKHNNEKAGEAVEPQSQN